MGGNEEYCVSLSGAKSVMVCPLTFRFELSTFFDGAAEDGGFAHEGAGLAVGLLKRGADGRCGHGGEVTCAGRLDADTRTMG